MVFQSIFFPDFKLDWSVSNFKLLGTDFSLDLSYMPDLNFRKKIIDVSKILKSWQHRKLTLLGKVTIIKTLALPKLINLLTSLPNLKQSLCNDLNKQFFNVIWDEKCNEKYLGTDGRTHARTDGQTEVKQYAPSGGAGV